MENKAFEVKFSDGNTSIIYGENIDDAYEKEGIIPSAGTVESYSELVTHECIDCHEPFLMTKAHEKWFTDKGLKIPGRCPGCRVLKKKKNDDPKKDVQK